MRDEIKLFSLQYFISFGQLKFKTNSEHNELKTEIDAAAKRYGCSTYEIMMIDIEYPDEIIW